MSSQSSRPSQIENPFLVLPCEGSSAYRVRVARQRAELSARRLEETGEQTSLHNAPDQRIGWWERVHHMRLPTDPEHPLVGIVAKQTGLSLEQVRHEQRRRLAATNPGAIAKQP